jgi:hypothetical protein
MAIVLPQGFLIQMEWLGYGFEKRILAIDWKILQTPPCKRHSTKPLSYSFRNGLKCEPLEVSYIHGSIKSGKNSGMFSTKGRRVNEGGILSTENLRLMTTPRDR